MYICCINKAVRILKNRGTNESEQGGAPIGLSLCCPSLRFLLHMFSIYLLLPRYFLSLLPEATIRHFMPSRSNYRARLSWKAQIRSSSSFFCPDYYVFVVLRHILYIYVIKVIKSAVWLGQSKTHFPPF